MRHTGFFRHLVIRQAHNTGHILINLVVSTDNLITQDMETQRVACKDILASHVELQSLVTTMLVTYNNTLSDAVARKDTTSDVLRGDGVIFEELHYPMESKAIDIHTNTETYIIQDGQAIAQETTIKKIQTNDITGDAAIVRFRISPFSFFQTNTRAAQELFRTAADMIGDIKGTIFDLYCGAGAIGQSFLAMNK
jgi:tRNA/tmRNA/rRNA uracil-C5-methylase (TrmA/RlmC/RlmD family)